MLFGEQVAIVTGAARGIGRGIARCLAEEGASLALCDLNGEGLEETLGMLPPAAQPHRGYEVDVGDSAAVTQFATEVLQTYGRVDILVNNAGLLIRRDVLGVSGDEWERVLAVNLKGPFLLIQAVARHMVADGIKGSIVNIASTSAQYSQPAKATYSATKAGLVHLTRCAAVELGAYGIRVNVICPGPTLTPMIAPRVNSEYLKRKGSLLSGIGYAVDIANAVVFLCSPDAHRVTGATFNIDSGQQLY
jgi:NAD(P)-dependent dehydrogenase (short-subunit alcohol dehydrogenase family)